MKLRAIPFGLAWTLLFVAAACEGGPSLIGGGDDADGDAAPVDADAWAPPLDADDWTPPLDADVWTPPLDADDWTPPLDADAWTPPLDADAWTPPLDADAWTPPLDDAGDTGWGDSTVPWVPPVVPECEGMPGPEGGSAFDLWSDSAGVWVLWAWDDIRFLPDGSWTTGPPMYSLTYNGGAGWVERLRGACAEVGGRGCLTWLAGKLEGDLLLWGREGTAATFDGTTLAYPWPELWGLGSDLFVVRDDLAYAVWRAGSDVRIIHWNGVVWSPIPAGVPFDVADQASLWADDDDLFCAGSYAALVSLEGDAWRIHDPGTLSDLTSIWGFEGDDVWVGTRAGELLHFDGTTWRRISWSSLEDDTPCNQRSAISRMWGSGGVLYFITDTQLARWDGTRVEVLGHWPGTRTTDPEGLETCLGGMQPVSLWGNRPDEVFVAVVDSSELYLPWDSYCHGGAVLRWDGTALHRF
ncbi:MAG: hypothetical protein JXB32_03590 [Deltaproteobacteria bacterium]|nr:hypothetical protein [Deltaproteobacteria bacterium]